MKKWLTLSYLLCCAPLVSEEPLLFQDQEQELIIYNRVLTQVNGKTISVLDVVKRMDLFLQKNYPHLCDSKIARYQFFSSHWKEYLNQIIDTELMLIDAEKLEIKIPESEIREEILNRFGPNVMPTLDKLDVTYEEAKQLIHDEFVVQRISWFRVNSKALSQVNSQDVKVAYKNYIEKNPQSDEWEYQVLSIRSSDPTINAQITTEVSELIPTCSSLADLSSKLQEKHKELSISLSSDIQASEQSLADSHRTILKTLTPSHYSPPIAQVSRTDGSTVHRVFFLKSHKIKTVPPFEKLADQLKNELLQEIASKENERYLRKLKQKLGFDEKHTWDQIPADFQPFSLR